MNKDVLQYIFQYLSPYELYTIMLVSKNWYSCATVNPVWYRHKKRILSVYPNLEPYFDNNPIYCTVIQLANTDFVKNENLSILAHVFRQLKLMDIIVEGDGYIIDTVTPFVTLEEDITYQEPSIDWSDRKNRLENLREFYHVILGIDVLEPKRKKIKLLVYK